MNGTIEEAPEEQADDNIPDYDNLGDDDDDDDDDEEIKYSDGPG
jgi:hypothetical protein